MQTCSLCNASSPDTTVACVNCRANLRDFSTNAVSLHNMRQNPHVKAIRISIAHDACPYCYELMQTYPKDQVPQIPHQGCSHPNGCRCVYEPVLAQTAIVGKVVK